MTLSSSFLDTWFSCDNLNISCFIAIKFYNMVSDYKNKVGIDFRGYGPIHIGV